MCSDFMMDFKGTWYNPFNLLYFCFIPENSYVSSSKEIAHYKNTERTSLPIFGNFVYIHLRPLGSKSCPSPLSESKISKTKRKTMKRKGKQMKSAPVAKAKIVRIKPLTSEILPSSVSSASESEREIDIKLHISVKNVK